MAKPGRGLRRPAARPAASWRRTLARAVRGTSAGRALERRLRRRVDLRTLVARPPDPALLPRLPDELLLPADLSDAAIVEAALARRSSAPALRGFDVAAGPPLLVTEGSITAAGAGLLDRIGPAFASPRVALVLLEKPLPQSAVIRSELRREVESRTFFETLSARIVDLACEVATCGYDVRVAPDVSAASVSLPELDAALLEDRWGDWEKRFGHLRDAARA